MSADTAAIWARIDSIEWKTDDTVAGFIEHRGDTVAVVAALAQAHGGYDVVAVCLPGLSEDLMETLTTRMRRRVFELLTQGTSAEGWGPLSDGISQHFCMTDALAGISDETVPDILPNDWNV